MTRIWFFPFFFIALACGNPSIPSASLPSNEESKQTSGLNPNGDSELALLMRQMTDFMRQSLDSLQKESPLPKVPDNLQGLTTAEATEGMIQDRNHFNGFASLWLNKSKTLDTAQSLFTRREAYHSLQQSCLSCHSQYCQGPIPMIQGLSLPEN